MEGEYHHQRGREVVKDRYSGKGEDFVKERGARAYKDGTGVETTGHP